MNTQFIESLWNDGLVPVGALSRLGADNEPHNINADHMAAAWRRISRRRPFRSYLTDVAGVLDGERRLGGQPEEIERSVHRRVVSSGTISKLKS